MGLDLGTGILLGAVGLLAANRLVLGLPGFERRKALFWTLQLVNLAAACFMVLHGVPELRGLAFYANWVIALLFMLHIVQNNQRYSKARKALGQGSSDGLEAERSRIKAALQRGEERNEEG